MDPAMLGFSFSTAFNAVRFVVDPSYAYKKIGEKVMSMEAYQEYICPLLKSDYAQAAKQDAAKTPDAITQASVAAAEYATAGCKEPLPEKSAQYPSGVKTAPTPTIPRREPGTQEFVIIEEPPFYKKTGFWLGVGLVAAAGAGTYVIFRRR